MRITLVATHTLPLPRHLQRSQIRPHCTESQAFIKVVWWEERRVYEGLIAPSPLFSELLRRHQAQRIYVKCLNVLLQMFGRLLFGSKLLGCAGV